MQIQITGVSTVLVEGSEDQVNFINVSDPPSGYVGSSIVVLDRRVPYYRARISAFTNGSVNAIIGHGRSRSLLVNFRERPVENP